ncbi:MAG TPA: phosphatidylglycerophosphatase A [Patescibacteria group bacterium]|nr:phosphatidylglycerophosphatase A [Patescibacteria group bacterium]
MPPDVEPIRRAPLAWLIATFFGVGLFPFASGTIATAATVPVYVAGYLAGGDLAILALALLFTITGVAAAGAMETRLGYHDPSEVVVDEVAGFLVTMLFLPMTVATCVAGFLLFRALDILKPWPASRAEKLPGGWGIMADDIVCGVIANAIIHLGVLLWR